MTTSSSALPTRPCGYLDHPSHLPIRGDAPSGTLADKAEIFFVAKSGGQS